MTLQTRHDDDDDDDDDDRNDLAVTRSDHGSNDDMLGRARTGRKLMTQVKESQIIFVGNMIRNHGLKKQSDGGTLLRPKGSLGERN